MLTTTANNLTFFCVFFLITFLLYYAPCLFLGTKFLISAVLCLSVADAAFHVVPTRLQLFEYESVRFTCEGFNVSAGWKVRNIKEFIPQCSNGTVTSTVTCTIDYAFVSDSGEYWCEGGGGKKSNTVNITVTGMMIVCRFQL